MSEKTALTKTAGKKTKESVSTKPKENLFQSIDSPVEQILHLQRVIGNRAVQRLLNSGTLQAKLKIGKPNDKYEQEADRVADRVMSMPKPKLSLGQPRLQRVTDEEEPNTLRTKAAGARSRTASPAVEAGIQSLKGKGQPLPESTRSYFEPRFGKDFSRVRVHTGSIASDTAKSINAKAFTKGKDVVFGSGQYSPGTSSGKRLIAHELTHVIQQGAGSNKTVSDITQLPLIQRQEGPRQIQNTLPKLQGSKIDKAGQRLKSWNTSTFKNFRALTQPPEDIFKEWPVNPSRINKAFVKPDPASWDYKLLVEAFDRFSNILKLGQSIRRLLNQKWTKRRGRNVSFLEAILSQKQKKELYKLMLTYQSSNVSFQLNSILTKVNPSRLRLVMRCREFIRDQLKKYAPQPTGQSSNLGDWLNERFVKKAVRTNLPCAWAIRGLIKGRGNTRKPFFAKTLNRKHLELLLEQLGKIDQKPFSDRVKKFLGFFKSTRKLNISSLESFFMDFKTVDTLVKIMKESTITRKWPNTTLSIYKKISRLLKSPDIIFMSRELMSKSRKKLHQKKRRELKRVFRILKLYFKALKKLPQQRVRRAAIAYQKLLVTTNILDKAWSMPYEVKEKLDEHHYGDALAMLRWFHRQIIKLLRKKLEKAVHLGVLVPVRTGSINYRKLEEFKKIPGLEWQKLSRYFRGKYVSGGLSTYSTAYTYHKDPSKHSRGLGRFRFKRLPSGRIIKKYIKGPIIRSGRDHEYGALDINAPEGSPIRLLFQKEIEIYDLPNAIGKINGYFGRSIVTNQTKLPLVKGAVGPVSKTNPIRDLAQKMLTAVQYKVKLLKQSTKPPVMLRNWRDRYRHQYQKEVYRIKGLNANVIRLWSALSLPSSSYTHPVKDGHIDIRLREEVNKIKAGLRDMLREAKIPLDLVREKAPGSRFTREDVKRIRKLGAAILKKRWKGTVVDRARWIRIRNKHLERIRCSVDTIYRLTRYSSIQTSNSVDVLLTYEKNGIEVKALVATTHMYRLADGLKEKQPIDRKSPILFVGLVGTTGGSSTPHLHIGASYTLYANKKRLCERPCSPLAFLKTR